MGFTKLDEGILQSSIIGESGDVFKIWIALLASCKEDGTAKVSPIFLSSVCGLEMEVVIKALDRLMEPDPFSRSKEDEGRRIREVDGGYFLINYKKYRDRTYSGTKEAVRKRQQREAEYSEDFLAFWAAYPKKVGKGAAWTEWQKLTPPIQRCLITLSWQKVSEQWTKENGKYILDPERWIKRRHWEDENSNIQPQPQPRRQSSPLPAGVNLEEFR